MLFENSWKYSMLIRNNELLVEIKECNIKWNV